MTNHHFFAWDEVGGDIVEFTLPTACHQLLTLPAKIIVDLADVWRADEVNSDIGHERNHLDLDDGTHILSALWGRDKNYAIAWHPTARDKARAAIVALSRGEDLDPEDEAEAVLIPLAAEIKRKLKAAPWG